MTRRLRLHLPVSPYDDRGASRGWPSACRLQRPVRRSVPRLGFNRPFQMPASSTVLRDERPGCLQGGFLLDTDPRRRINELATNYQLNLAAGSQRIDDAPSCVSFSESSATTLLGPPPIVMV